MSGRFKKNSLFIRPGSHLLLVLLFCLISDINERLQDGHSATSFISQNVLARAQQVALGPPEPALYMILPQSFSVPLRNERSGNSSQLQQYVAIINNAQNDLEDQQIRQKYPKLSLQIRDSRRPLTGQLFFETIFDYFPAQGRNHLLLPVDLEQISPTIERTTNNADNANSPLAPKATFSNKISSSVNSALSAADKAELFSTQAIRLRKAFEAQRLIVSIRPVGENGLGSETEELVSSAPVVVEPVSSSDGQRAFSLVQTDKPIYKPNERVKIRALVVSESLRPILGEEVRIQIKNPHRVVVEEVRFPRANNQMEASSSLKQPVYLDHVFEFPPEPMLGSWTVQLVHNDPIANDTTSFEVREYTLPSFEVLLRTPDYVLLNTNFTINVSATAKYHYGKPVRGFIQFKFSYRESLSRTRAVAQTQIKKIDPETGRLDFSINSTRFENSPGWPPQSEAHLVVEALVTEAVNGHREVVEDSSCKFIKMPYKISFEHSIDDFKPGLTQQLKVQLVEATSGKPGPAGTRLVAEYRDQYNRSLNSSSSLAADGNSSEFHNRLDTEAFTDQRGEAVFNVGPVRENTSLIYVSIHAPNSNETAAQVPDKKKRSARNELASGQFSLRRHESQNGWISLMNKSTTSLQVGQSFVSDILIRDALVIPKKIFYVIINRGHIVTLSNLDSNGLVNFEITTTMMPSIRVVLFALTHDSVGLLSDSMRINVDQDLDCGLSLSFSSKSERKISTDTARPNEVGSIEVNARRGDVVSLIGIDHAVHSLNKRTRLQSSRIMERVKRLDPGCGFGGGRDNLDVFHNAGLMLFRNSTGVGLQPAPVGTSCFSFAQLHKYVEDSLMGYTRPMLYNHIKAKSVEQKVRRLQYRAKREVNIDAMLDNYTDARLRECCRLGTYEDEPQRRSCDVRASIVAKYMRDSGKCAAAYLDCCNRVYEQGSQLRVASMGLYTTIEKIARSEVHPLQSAAYPNEALLARIESQTLVRRDFRESWLFDIVTIEAATGKASLDVQLPHSITAWSISALALNEERPMCFMPRPLLVSAFQEVFLHVKMPYKVVQGEQIDLVVTLFNYSPEKQNVLVYMYGVDDVCSDAEPGERSQRQRISIERHSSELAIFPLIPLRPGTYSIKIVAATVQSNTSDIIERELLVVPRGRPVTDETTFSLDPMNQQRRSKRAIQTGNLVDEIDSQRGLQRSRIRLTPSREFEHIVPQTQECIVSAVGDKMGQTVQTTILDVENLIRLPHGCGEQVMIYLGPTLYTARYLDSLGRLTGDMRWRANRYIQSGYKRVLNFRHQEGGFSAFAGREPSVWLTAFIAKMLCQAERTHFVAKEVHVDKMVIRSALNWLVARQDAERGSWTEKNPVYHREMLGGVLKEKGLTAFVAITLSECSRHSFEVVDEAELEKQDSAGEQVSLGSEQAHNGAASRLAKVELAAKGAERALLVDSHRALREKNAYVLALMAYSLSLTNQSEALAILDSLMSLSERWQSRNHLFWRGDHQVETAAYALQAIIELAPLVTSPEQIGGRLARPSWSAGLDAVAIANWLSTRRSYTGAFDSTQDTIVALEALSKFAQLQPTPDGTGLIPQPLDEGAKLHCNVTVGNRTRRSIDFGKDNAQILQTFKLNPDELNAGSEETLDIVTSGNGVGSMTIKLKYNIFLPEDGLCRFNIDPSIEEWRAGSNMDTNAVPTPSENKEAATEQFPRAMLAELNLRDSGEPETGPVQQAAHSNPVLRLRRLAPVPAASALEPEASHDSWSAKLSASIRSFWLSSKSTSTTTPRPSTTHDESTFEPTSLHDVQRRNSPQRRSTPQALAALPTPTPNTWNETHLNSLDSKIEIFARNQSSLASPNHGTHIIEDPNKHLILLLRVCAHHMSTQSDELSGMAVMEVGILSGFKPNEADLKQISRDRETLVKKYEISADRSVVIFYLDYIPSSGPLCLQFRLIQDSPVYNLQSAYIRVYDYYSQSAAQSCSSFYTPTRLRELLRTKCDASRQVCQCVFLSMCPPTRKLTELATTHASNVTSAQQQLMDLVCKDKYDLVSFVKVKKTFAKNEVSRELKLWVKIDSDLRGNLSQMVELQRQQKSQLPARHPLTSLSGDQLSLDYLQLTINDTCLQGGDPLLMHLDQESNFDQRQAGEQMLLFARSRRLERRPLRTANRGPAPKANIFTLNNGAPRQIDEREPNPAALAGAQNQQYSLTLPLDREALLQDVSYRAKSRDREAINSLIRWLENQKRLKNWTCLSR